MENPAFPNDPIPQPLPQFPKASDSAASENAGSSSLMFARLHSRLVVLHLLSCRSTGPSTGHQALYQQTPCFALALALIRRASPCHCKNGPNQATAHGAQPAAGGGLCQRGRRLPGQTALRRPAFLGPGPDTESESGPFTETALTLPDPEQQQRERAPGRGGSERRRGHRCRGRGGNRQSRGQLGFRDAERAAAALEQRIAPQIIGRPSEAEAVIRQAGQRAQQLEQAAAQRHRAVCSGAGRGGNGRDHPAARRERRRNGSSRGRFCCECPGSVAGAAGSNPCRFRPGGWSGRGGNGGDAARRCAGRAHPERHATDHASGALHAEAAQDPATNSVAHGRGQRRRARRCSRDQRGSRGCPSA